MIKKTLGGKMKHNGNFTHDLKFSQEAEEYTVNKLKEKWPKTKRVEGNFKGYDIIIPEKDWKIEVKLDRRTLDTGNLFIEYESRKDPSGIKTTTADWWFYYYNPEDFKECIRVETKTLEKMIEDKNFKEVPGGDKDSSWGYLIPTGEFDTK